jgi:hypothetical protein
MPENENETTQNISEMDTASDPAADSEAPSAPSAGSAQIMVDP